VKFEADGTAGGSNLPSNNLWSLKH